MHTTFEKKMVLKPCSPGRWGGTNEIFWILLPWFFSVLIRVPWSSFSRTFFPFFLLSFLFLFLPQPLLTCRSLLDGAFQVAAPRPQKTKQTKRMLHLNISGFIVSKSRQHLRILKLQRSEREARRMSDRGRCLEEPIRTTSQGPILLFQF